MGGKISVSSIPGQGSVFTVKFPLAGEEVGDLSIETNKLESPQPGESHRENAARPLVLYVEDDPANREIMSIFLQNTCQIETAPDGETALGMVKERKYDLVLMDINLVPGRTDWTW